MKELILITLLASIAWEASLGQASETKGSSARVSHDDLDAREAADAPYVIFSNLDRTPGDRYNSDGFFAFPVAGKDAVGETETWQAVRFTPKVDVQAKVLMAAIGYTSGVKTVRLGLYTDNEITRSVGTLLAGGEGSTSQIPDLGTCCQLAKVRLENDGVFLAANTPFWLVASPDNLQASTFRGAWHLSNGAKFANRLPPAPWQTPPGAWPAAEIRGTKVQTLGPVKAAATEADGPAGNVVIFSNLDRSPNGLFYLFGAGLPITGSAVEFEPEIWDALPFTPKTNVHVTTLAAAVGYVSGTKKMYLSVHADSGGTVGDLLPGGQGSTTKIPDLGECCPLTKVTLPGTGVELLAGVQYWCTATTDDESAPDFEGAWQQSNLAVNAFQQPENFVNWTSASGLWLAAEIQGTKP